MKDVAVKKVSQVADMAEKQLAGVSERLNEVTEAATDLVHEAKRTVRRELQNRWEQVEDTTQDLERYIRRNPLKATLMALGAGAALGLGIGLMIRGRK